jgi:hypothetical protein
VISTALECRSRSDQLSPTNLRRHTEIIERSIL